MLAGLTGSTGRTARGTAYRVVDVRAETVDAEGPPWSLLAGAQVSRAWRQAGVRVLLARAVTDLADGYAGCLDALPLLARPIPGASHADDGAGWGVARRWHHPRLRAHGRLRQPHRGTWSADFRVDGGAWTPIPETVTVPGPDTVVTVKRARAVLVG